MSECVRFMFGDQPDDKVPVCDREALVHCELSPAREEATGILILMLYTQAPFVGADKKLVDDRFSYRTVDEVAEALAMPGLPPDGTGSKGPFGYSKKEWKDAITRRTLDALEPVSRNGDTSVLRRAIVHRVESGAGREPSGALTFGLASCQYSPGMVDGTPAVGEWNLPGPADASYMRLAKHLEKRRDPRPIALILAGDQVYADATAGLFDPTTLDEPFRIAYERFLSSVGPQSVLGRIPVFMVLDDHEIVDNWEPEPLPVPVPAPGLASEINPTGRRSPSNADRMKLGRSEYIKYQRRHWPPRKKNRLWTEEMIGGVPFFFSDTRTEREARTGADVDRKSIMSPEQMASLLKYLAEHQKSRCFVVSPSILLPRRRVAIGDVSCAIRSDAWDGYPKSLQCVLAGISNSSARHVVFLSGDEHISCVTRIKVTRFDENGGAPSECVVRSIHSSGLYTPYPFANSLKEELAGNETFCFAHGTHRYRCEVSTSFPECGEGFALVTADPEGNKIEVLFDGSRKRVHYTAIGDGPWQP
jgi:hypothetical protein